MQYLRRYGFVLLVVVALLLPFVFYSSDLSEKRELSLLERGFYMVSRPVQATILFFSETTRRGFQNYIDLRNAKSEAGQLREQNAQLNVQIQVFRELEGENMRLRQLLNFAQRIDLKFVTGEVQSADPSFVYKSIRLNRGEADGVQPGMAVVGGEGAVGVIMRTLKNTCDVLLITDPNSNLDVIVARNRRRGVLEGAAGPYMKFKYTDRGSRVQVGDEIVTSGLTGAFPRGISVGRVSQVSVDADGVSQIIDVQPSVNLERLSEGLILLRPSKEIEVIQGVGGKDWMKKILESGGSRAGG